VSYGTGWSPPYSTPGASSGGGGPSVVPWFDVRNFGPWTDGVDCTTTLVKALAAAGAAGGPATVIIPAISNFAGAVGVYIGAYAAVYTTAPNIWPGVPASLDARTVVIPDNVTLKGFGFASMLTVNPADLNAMANQVTVPWIVEGIGTTVEDLHFDGAGTDWANANNFLFVGVCSGNPTRAINNCVKQRCLFTNMHGPAGDAENGYMCTGGYQATNVSWRDLLSEGTVWAYQMGIYIPGEPGASVVGFTITNCKAYGCSFGGVSCYSSSKGHVVGCTTVASSIGATLNGFNVEWSTDIVFDGCESYQCGTGINAGGNGIVFFNGGCLRDNETWGINYSGGDPNTYPITPGGGNYTSSVQIFVINGTYVDKGSGGHAQFPGVVDTTGSPNNPLSVASLIRINVPDSASWVIVNSTNPAGLVPGLQLVIQGAFTPLAIGETSTWTPGSGISISAYGGGGDPPGSLNPEVISIASGASGVLLMPGDPMLANRTYRLRYALACSNATGGGQYQVTVRDSSGAVLLQTNHPSDASVFTKFIAYDGVFTVGANPAHIEIGSVTPPTANGFDGVLAWMSIDEVQVGGSLSGN
jgi:hypothetical protein